MSLARWADPEELPPVQAITSAAIRPTSVRDSFLVVACDQPTRAAAALVASRIHHGTLSDLGGRWVALQRSGRGLSGIPFSPLDQPGDSLVRAGHAAWGALAAAGYTGELIVTVVRSVTGADDLQDLRICVEEVDEIFRGAKLPIRLLTCAVLLRPIDLIENDPSPTSIEQDRDELSPSVVSLAFRALSGLTGLALPPVLLNLFPPGGPISEELVPQAIAELLELMAGNGPNAVFGPYEDPEKAHRKALVVALDAIEVPNVAERQYLRLRLIRHWLDGLLHHEPVARLRKVPPQTAQNRSVQAISKAADNDLRTIRRAADQRLRQARRDLDALVAPRILKPLAPGDQRDLVRAANERVVCPETGWRDQILGDLSLAVDKQRTVAAVARTEARRLAGNFHGGIRLAEECVLEAVARLDEIERRKDAQLVGQPGRCDEPALTIDPMELDEWRRPPRVAPWRTSLGWLVLLTGGVTAFSASLTPVSPLPLLSPVFGPDAGTATVALALSIPVLAVFLLWQAVQFGRSYRERSKLIGLPQKRFRQRLIVWRVWFNEHELPRRLATDVAGVLEEIQLLRERLTTLLGHVETEEAAERARLTGSSFPRRAARSERELQEFGVRLERRCDLNWLLNELARRWETGDDLAAFGERLCSLLESMVLTAGISTSGDALLWRLAGAAIAQELGARQLDSLDSRLDDPAATLEAMHQRAQPVGSIILGVRFVGDPDSRLARLAAEADWEVLDRMDHARGTLIAVSVRRL